MHNIHESESVVILSEAKDLSRPAFWMYVEAEILRAFSSDALGMTARRIARHYENTL